ncbi:MAG TPA: tetratricopeptide repeat protein [Pyrinomonadaceae bacterium]|nr:tetratricopeptide repeat protein [Pyrinomonadaceae bacterium]
MSLSVQANSAPAPAYCCFCLLLLLLLPTAPAPAPAPAPARDTWVSIRSKHLLLIGNGSEKDIRLVAVQLEQFREVISQVFARPDTESSIPTTVIVFKDDSSYSPFKTNENNAGYFQPGQDVNYITLSTESRGEQDPFNIIFHEYTHLLVNNSIGNSPAWFNEGLAELYSTLSITGDKRVILGRPIRRHITSLHQNPLLPLRVLLQVDYKSPYYNESNKQSIFYAESWALMHFLMLNKSGERANQVLPFLELLRQQVPIEQAFQKSFGTSFGTIEAEFRSYIQLDRFRPIETSLNRNVQSDARVTSAFISEAEAQAYLGDLLLHSNRVEAEIYLQRALTLDPKLTLANASLGILRFRQGRMAESLAFLERAVAAESQNALVHYYYASVLSKPGEADAKLTLGFAPEVAAKARAELKKAIALRPDFPDSYNLLAYLNLVTNTEIAETIELLNGGLARLGNRVDFVYMLGQIYMHNDDYKRARPLLEQVVLATTDAGVRSHSQKLLSTMTAIEEQQTQKEAARRTRGVRPNPVTQPSFAAASPAAPDPSVDLREALRIPTPGETQVQGILLGVECEATGLVFLVKTNDRTLRLRTDSFQQIRRTTFTADVKGTITCGARKPENPVVVCYLPSSDKRAKVDGVLSSVEFVPADFRLIPIH